ncbi:MAG: hypothetical protein HYW24_01255 [Candidatus Aenigmarchaeota archaeon]|nr:hypothetical protein [Candidatus Aenigmarchaeota archaeon]
MKGMYYTIEAAIAAVMILSVFLLLFLGPPNNPEVDRANVKSDIYTGLESLNARGSLRQQALNNNATGIKNDLASFLPVDITVSVSIYNKTPSNLTEEVIDQNTDMIGVSYYVVGDVGNYTPKEIRVHAWGFE